MREFQKKHKFKRRLYSLPVLLVLLLLLFAVFNGAYNMYDKYSRNSAELDQALEEAERMRERKEELTEELAYLETRKGVEEEIRNKYDVVKEGEKVVVIIDDEGGEGVEEASASKAGGSGFWSRIWQSITSIFSN